MTWWMIVLVVVVVFPFLLWGLWALLWRLARRGDRRRITVTLFRPDRPSEQVFVYFYYGHWLSKLVPGTGIAGFGGGAIRVYLDYPPQAAVGQRVTSLWVALHELGHGWQGWWMGVGYFPSYFWHRFVLWRSWRRHQMEREANRLAREMYEGYCPEIEVDIRQMRTLFPHEGRAL